MDFSRHSNIMDNTRSFFETGGHSASQVMASPQSRRSDEEDYMNIFTKFAFPFKLNALLEDAINNCMSDIVSWLPHGMAFRIHKPKEFAEHVMPKYFKKTKYRSFQRQLQIYGFRRVKDRTSADNGAHYHKLFVRGKKALCLQMTRERIKDMATDDRTNHHEPPAQEALSGISAKLMKRNRTMASSSSPPRKYPLAAVPALIEHALEDEVTDSSALGGALACNEEAHVSVNEWVSFAQKIIAQVDRSNQEIEQIAALPSCDHAGRQPSFIKSGGHRNSAIKDNEVGGNLSVAHQQDLRDGDESSFAGKRFYFVKDFHGDITKWPVTEHHDDCLKAPLPLKEATLQDQFFHLGHDSYKLRGGRAPVDSLLMLNPAA